MGWDTNQEKFDKQMDRLASIGNGNPEDPLKTVLKEGLFKLNDIIQNTNPQPQRQTGNMKSAFEIHVGTDFVEDGKIPAPGRLKILLSPNLNGLSPNEGRLFYVAPYAPAQNAGQMKRLGKLITLKPTKPGTGPGWFTKLNQSSNKQVIHDFISERLSEVIDEEANT
ncbi:minor capsid protein (plasmid) [Leptospira interrogans]|uniref:minor capsid protein n=1 Tax=Leptospira interrogans TaxID=173 RepID=UPI001F076703|nr:minor capsid protein [Leptospira interrogans]UML83130.1 minor capsid protein [Leptospira interrogans]